MNSKVQLLVLGDYMQGLYEFKGSDIRYLTFGDLIWCKHPLLISSDFEMCSMKMSYRITNQIRDFGFNSSGCGASSSPCNGLSVSPAIGPELRAAKQGALD